MSDIAPCSAALEARGLRFGYGGTPLFSSLDVTIAAGEFVGLIGPNGSGKTTLLNLLSGGLKPSMGEARLFDRDLCEMPARERARVIAIVPQEGAMTFDFTVMEMVLMGRTPWLGLLGVEAPADVAAAEGALRMTGVAALGGRLLSRLSGGERQLVTIARALAQAPAILLLDEPTSHLDIRHRLEIYELLSRLNRERGMTIVTTSHDINMAARWCPRLILMKQGHIHADGAPADVFSEATLQEVYETRLSVVADPVSGLPYALPPGPSIRPGAS